MNFFLTDFVTAEMNPQIGVTQRIIKQGFRGDNASAMNYEIICSVEFFTEPGYSMMSIPNFKCEGLFFPDPYNFIASPANRFSHSLKKVQGNDYSFFNTENFLPSKTSFFNGATVVQVNGDLKNCQTTQNCFPAKKIAGLIGIKFNISPKDCFQSLQISIV